MVNYDAIAREYMAERGKLKSGKYVYKLLRVLPKGAKILDVGCGAGVPVDDLLLANGCEVTGLDNSEAMLEMAKENCPGASYELKEIQTLQMKEYQVGAVVSFYAVFHTPRNRHGELMRIFRSYLPKSGYMLITMGEKDFEGEHEMYGKKMWSSQWGTKKNRELVEKAGFEILLDEVDRSGGEAHQVILAQAI